MKRLHITTLIVLAILTMAAWIFWPMSAIRYIQKTTGIVFPKGVSDVDVYDNGENYIVSHLTLPKDSISIFASAYPFEKCETTRLTVFGSERLKQEHQQLQTGAELLAFQGRSEHNRWEVLLDRRSGEMLISVLHPDHSGDNP